MEIDRVIAIVETVLAPRSLSPLEIQIMRGAIDHQSYQEITIAMACADKWRSKRYQLSYVKETGANLWQSLSLRLGQKVTKKNFGAVLLWHSKNSIVNIPEIAKKSTPIPATIDWGDRLEGTPISTGSNPFYGRIEELTTLTNWCEIERCQTISLLGMGGMGKTTLAWKLVEQLAGGFEFAIWRSLVNAPPVTDILGDWLRCLSVDLRLALPDSVEGQIELLIADLTRHRCLLVLDNVESILQGEGNVGQYLLGYGAYGQLFQAIGELNHHSCLLIASRELPHTLARSATSQPNRVRSFPVVGLASDSARKLVEAYGSPQIPAQMWQEVYAHYSGNPLALKMATIAAVEMTGGGEAMLQLYPLMKEGKLPFQTIEDILERQFNRLSSTEQQLMYWLAIEREPVTGQALRANLIPNPTIEGKTLDALQSLVRRCIVQRQGKTWLIEPVMMNYLTARAIAQIVTELAPDPPDPEFQHLEYQLWHLNQYPIVQAQTKDYLLRAQTQLILRPILARLVDLWGSAEALDRHLRQMIRRWQSLKPVPLGYLAGNILNLLAQLSEDRSIVDLDLSQLPIWSAYLVDVNLHRVNFTQAGFDRSVFTQAFGGIVSVAYHPHGDLVATGDGNGDIQLWRLSDGQRVAIYHGHANWVRSLTFTPDGTILASSSDDLTIGLWEIATGRKLLTLGSPTQGFRRVSFSRDGQKLFAGSNDARLRIYDFRQLLSAVANPTVAVECIQELTGHNHWVFSATLSPDERQLATASADGTVRIWELATSQVIHILVHSHWAIRTIFSPDGRRLIVSGMSATIYIWDTISGKLIQTLTGHTDWVWSIDLTPDGHTLVSAGEDRTIRVWDVATGICTAVFRAHQQRIWAIAISPDGQQFISGSEDRTLKIWDLDQGKCLKTFNGNHNWIKSIAIVADRRWLLSGHHDSKIRIWDLERLRCIQILEGHTDGILAITVSPNGDYLASSSLDRTIRLWDLTELRCIHTLNVAVEGSWGLAFSPDGDRLIAAIEQGQIQIWQIVRDSPNYRDILQPNRSISTDLHKIQSLAISNRDNSLATAWADTIKIWDISTGKCLHSFETQQRNHAIAFSPDGRYLAVGSMDTTVKIWETTNWECLQTLRGHQGWIMTLAFSLDGDDRLITGSCDRSIKHWNIFTGECLQTYHSHTNWVWSIAYLPPTRSPKLDPSSRIVSASEDGTIHIWDINQNTPIHTLQLPRPYEDTNITQATGLLPGQRQTLQLLGAIGEHSIIDN